MARLLKAWLIFYYLWVNQLGATMKASILVPLSLVGGIALGAITVNALQAQAKGPAYFVAEVEMLDEAAMREFGPKVAAVTRAHGGKYLVRSNTVTAIEGTPPKILIIATFDSVEKIQAYRNSPDYKALNDLRDKSSRERSYAAEGLPPN